MLEYLASLSETGSFPDEVDTTPKVINFFNYTYHISENFLLMV